LEGDFLVVDLLKVFILLGWLVWAFPQVPQDSPLQVLDQNHQNPPRVRQRVRKMMTRRPMRRKILLMIHPHLRKRF
jgi:hypothetical protein